MRDHGSSCQKAIYSIGRDQTSGALIAATIVPLRMGSCRPAFSTNSVEDFLIWKPLHDHSGSVEPSNEQ